MKRFILLITLVSAIASCAPTSLSTRIDDYVSEVEGNYQKWTEKDWELSQQEYEQLLLEYEANYNSLSQEEKDKINRAIGRYNGLLLKEGIKEAESAIKEFGNQLPSLIEGFMSAFEGENE